MTEILFEDIKTIKSPYGYIWDSTQFPKEFVLIGGYVFRPQFIVDTIKVNSSTEMAWRPAFALITFGIRADKGSYHLTDEPHSLLFGLHEFTQSIREMNKLKDNSLPNFEVGIITFEIVQDNEPTVNSNGLKVSRVLIEVSREPKSSVEEVVESKVTFINSNKFNILNWLRSLFS